MVEEMKKLVCGLHEKTRTNLKYEASVLIHTQHVKLCHVNHRTRSPHSSQFHDAIAPGIQRTEHIYTNYHSKYLFSHKI